MACCGRGMSPRPNRTTQTTRKSRGTVTQDTTPRLDQPKEAPKVIQSSRKAFTIPSKT